MSPALDGVYHMVLGDRVVWCRWSGHQVFCHCCFTCCVKRADPPQGRAACAMPNDPLHITTHDASLPRERGVKIHYTKTNGPSIHAKISVECSSWETARLSTSDHLHHKSTLSRNITLLKGTKTHKHTLLFLTMIIPCMSHITGKTVEVDGDHQQQWSGRDKSGMRGLIWRELWPEIRHRCRWILQMGFSSPCGCK